MEAFLFFGTIFGIFGLIVWGVNRGSKHKGINETVGKDGAEAKEDTELNLTAQEEEALKEFVAQTRASEFAQVQDLIHNCDNKYQFAKTHKVYKKDWERTRRELREQIKRGAYTPSSSPAYIRALIAVGDEIFEEKLKKVRDAFIAKFGEPIDPYIRGDIKIKK